MDKRILKTLFDNILCRFKQNFEEQSIGVRQFIKDEYMKFKSQTRLQSSLSLESLQHQLSPTSLIVLRALITYNPSYPLTKWIFFMMTHKTHFVSYLGQKLYNQYIYYLINYLGKNSRLTVFELSTTEMFDDITFSILEKIYLDDPEIFTHSREKVGR